ncbi:MAG: hypothetical protein AABW80_05220 [Nanoarchaeota archaeon]
MNNKRGQFNAMSIFSIILGLLLVLAGIASISIDFSSYVENEIGFEITERITSWAVVLVGVLILFTPITRPAVEGVASQRVGFALIRRWLFGLVTLLIGLTGMFAPMLDWPILKNIALGTWSGGIVLILFGVVYFFAAFGSTRNMRVSTY